MAADFYPEIREPSIKIRNEQGSMTELDPHVISCLTAIALRNGTGYLGAITQSVINLNFIESQLEKGNNLLLLKPDGSMRRIDY